MKSKIINILTKRIKVILNHLLKNYNFNQF